MDLRSLLLYMHDNPHHDQYLAPYSLKTTFSPVHQSHSSSRGSSKKSCSQCIQPKRSQPPPRCRESISLYIQDPVSATSEALSNGLTSTNSFSFSNGFSFGGGTHSRRRLAASGSNANEQR